MMVVKGKAGRQLPGEAGAGIGIGCLGHARPLSGPSLGEGAAPQQGASPGAMGVRRHWEAAQDWGSNGGRILHPPLSCLPVATATQKQEHHFDRFLLGRGEAGCAPGRGEGGSKGSTATGVRRGLSQLP